MKFAEEVLAAHCADPWEGCLRSVEDELLTFRSDPEANAPRQDQRAEVALAQKRDQDGPDAERPKVNPVVPLSGSDEGSEGVAEGRSTSVRPHALKTPDGLAKARSPNLLRLLAAPKNHEVQVPHEAARRRSHSRASHKRRGRRKEEGKVGSLSERNGVGRKVSWKEELATRN